MSMMNCFVFPINITPITEPGHQKWLRAIVVIDAVAPNALPGSLWEISLSGYYIAATWQALEQHAAKKFQACGLYFPDLEMGGYSMCFADVADGISISARSDTGMSSTEERPPLSARRPKTPRDEPTPAADEPADAHTSPNQRVRKHARPSELAGQGEYVASGKGMPPAGRSQICRVISCWE